MFIPPFLEKGDTVAIVSPAGALSDISFAKKAAETLKSWGLNVLFTPHCFGNIGYYSGSIEERTKDILDAISDKSIKAILCSYGGYGCVHILEKFTDAIKDNPKWVMGMSDCTALLAGCLISGIASIHSAQCRQLSHGNSCANLYLKDILFGKMPTYTTETDRLNIEGEARGTIVGGNLSIISSLIGTPYNILQEKSILFIEDINEPLYRIERMMYQLKLTGALSKISGIIIGQFNNIKEQPGIGSSVYDIIHSVVADYNIPTCYNFPVGHCDNNFPMLIGADVELIINKNRVELTFKRG